MNKKICGYCGLKIGWSKDYFNFNWFGCECVTVLKKEEYFKELEKEGLKE